MKKLLPLVVLLGCSGPPSEGLVATTATGGPVVRYDISARPLPEIPLPNDAATRRDPASPTGRYLNISTEAATDHEREVRRTFNTLDGFGAYAPIFVGFDRPLDVVDLHRRHEDNDDFRDDAILLLNVDPDCARFGEEVALDVGGGHFPANTWTHAGVTPDADAPEGYVTDWDSHLFPLDDQGHYNGILFEERNEDRNGNGVLDPGEDLDSDGVLDVANLYDPQACETVELGTVEHDRCVVDNLMTFYERQTDTLILRPLWPLEQRCTHAVVLSNRLVGEDGRAVQSPFPWVHHRDQRQALEPALDLLPRYGLGAEDVAFAWTFTVGSMTGDLEALRAGLHGAGPFARFADEFPTASFHPWSRAELAAHRGEDPTEGLGDERVLPGGCVANALSWLWGPGLSEWDANRCSIEADLAAMGGLFGGTFAAPNLMVDRDGIANDFYPADNDEIWELNPQTGEAVYGTTNPTFWCALPQETTDACSPGNPEGMPGCKPFPTVLYAHGYGGSRAEISLHMGRHNALGVALCSLDSYGHGLNVWADAEAPELTLALGKFTTVGVRELATLLTRGRDRDLNNDGLGDPGMDMWTNDVFHTRDMIRQSVLEQMQFVRILRSADGVARDDTGQLLGDIDGDGVVDLGGPDNTVGLWGISLGGILSGVAAGAEPGLDAVSPNAGGAGLTDISVRSSQAGVPEAVVLPMLGQLVGGCLPVDEHQRPLEQGQGAACQGGGDQAAGTLRLRLFNQDQASFRSLPLAEVPGVAAGDRVELHNLSNGEVDVGRVGARGQIRLTVASDALDPIERRPVLGLQGGQRGPVVPADNAALGDRLELRVFDGDATEPKAVVSTFGETFDFQGTTYVAGTPLVALQDGFGYKRNTPDFRRFLGFAQHAIASADPGVWGAKTHVEPLAIDYGTRRGGDTRKLLMPTIGDRQVPISTGVAEARTSGLLGSWLRDEERFGPEVGWRELFAPDPRYGTSIDQWLIDRHVVEGVGELERWASHDPQVPTVLFDPDNVSDGTAEFTCGDSDWSALIGENGCPDELRGTDTWFTVPTPPAGDELRRDVPRGDGSYDGVRMPLLRPSGQHGIYNAQAFRAFDADAYMVNFTVRYLASRGRQVGHEAGCDCVASQIPTYWLDAEIDHPIQGEACTVDDLRVCSPACAEAWGVQSPAEAVCGD